MTFVWGMVVGAVILAIGMALGVFFMMLGDEEPERYP